MSSKYFNHSTNRTPDQRRLVRKYVDEQTVSGTVQNQESIIALDANSTSPQKSNNYDYQDINSISGVGIVGITGKRIWVIVVGGLTIIGLIIGIVVFFSDISSKITENRVNIETTNKIMDKQNEFTNSRIDVMERNIFEKIDEIKERIKGIIK